jgi:hypothetical protein
MGNVRNVYTILMHESEDKTHFWRPGNKWGEGKVDLMEHDGLFWLRIRISDTDAANTVISLRVPQVARNFFVS